MLDTSAEPKRESVLICDGAELVRRGIRDVLERDRRFVVVAETEDATSVAEVARLRSPKLIFLGIGRPGQDEDRFPGLWGLRQAFRTAPGVRAIVLVPDERPEDVLESLRAGAHGVLLRDAAGETVLSAARTVLGGGGVLDPHLALTLFSYVAGGADEGGAGGLEPSVLASLSPREREVLASLARGKRNKEIAAELGVSVGTVKTHLRHIFRKLTVNDRTAAVLTALHVRLPEAA